MSLTSITNDYLDDGIKNKSNIDTIVHAEKSARSYLNSKWLDMWHLYKTRPLRIQNEGDWQSRLNDGRVFELIETVGSYIRNALFFSDAWVSLESNEPDLAEVLPLVNVYFRNVLKNSNFKRELRLHLVQILLLGFSAIKVDWQDGCLKFECISAYDTYIDSSRRYDPKYSYVFTEREVDYGEFCDMYDSGDFDKLYESVDDVFQKLSQSTEEPREAYEMRETTRLADEQKVIIVDFYDPCSNTLYRTCGDQLLHEQHVEDCPLLIGQLFETPESAYGLSLIDSSIGLILENNVLMNRRLDNIAVSVDNMWLFVDDGVTNPDDIRTAPGKVISVGRPDSLTPLHPPHNNFNVTYQEASVLDTKIDRNIGTGALISANTYRSGERVTAQEINAVKDAGGNRLSDVYELLEAQVIIPLLQRAYSIVRKHTNSAKVVKLASDRSGIYDYFRMLPEDLEHDYSLSLSATQSIINRDRNISLLQQFLTTVAAVEQFQPFIDYQNLYYDMLVKFGFDDPSRYLKAQEAPSAPEPKSAMDAMIQTGNDIGGAPMTGAIQEMAAAGQLPQMAQSMLGKTPDPTQPIDEQLNTSLTAAMTIPQA